MRIAVRIKFIVIVCGVCTALFQCAGPDRKVSLEGTWRMDSVYSYYNGFAFTRRNILDEPLHRYKSDGSLTMTLKEESRKFYFSIPVHDSLIHLAPDKSILEKFAIVTLNGHILSLRKTLNPVFKGPQQERYEVRYFSKVKD
jgi:hypothetical protein